MQMSPRGSVRKASVSALDKMALDARSAGQRVWQSRFVRDVLLLSGGTGIAQVIALAMLPVLSRLYTPKTSAC